MHRFLHNAFWLAVRVCIFPNFFVYIYTSLKKCIWKKENQKVSPSLLFFFRSLVHFLSHDIFLKFINRNFQKKLLNKICTLQWTNGRKLAQCTCLKYLHSRKVICKNWLCILSWFVNTAQKTFALHWYQFECYPRTIIC